MWMPSKVFFMTICNKPSLHCSISSSTPILAHHQPVTSAMRYRNKLRHCSLIYI